MVGLAIVAFVSSFAAGLSHPVTFILTVSIFIGLMYVEFWRVLIILR
jgi:hypothetical protein